MLLVEDQMNNLKELKEISKLLTSSDKESFDLGINLLKTSYLYNRYKNTCIDIPKFMSEPKLLMESDSADTSSSSIEIERFFNAQLECIEKIKSGQCIRSFYDFSKLELDDVKIRLNILVYHMISLYLSDILNI